MISNLRVGRIGPFYLSLSYTWLFTTLLGLWWLALLWLPENYLGWTRGQYWLVAITVMFLFLTSVVLREWLRSSVSGATRPSLTLYPFGASTPYRAEQLGSGRMLGATVVTLMFNLVLGGALLLLSGLAGIDDWLKAILLPLGWLNLAVGVINLIPAMPFDGGRILSALVYWVTGGRETSIGVSRNLGEIAALAIVLVGAWRGLATQSWLEALALVVLGWAAREAEESARERSALRTALDTLNVRDVMDATRPGDEVRVDDTVSNMIRSHPRFPVDMPLPVLDAQQHTVGIVTLAAADTLMQGRWPSTSVSAIMTAPDKVQTVRPETSLTTLVQTAEENPVAAVDQAMISVIEKGRLLGSVDPDRLEAFEQIDLELGAEEAIGQTRIGLLQRFRSAIAPIMLLVAMAVVGNMAVNAEPDNLNKSGLNPSQAAVTFSDLTPGEGSVLPVGDTTITALLLGAQTVTTATIILDSQPLDITMVSMSPINKAISSYVSNLTQGEHLITIIAVTQGGYMGRTQWHIWAGPKDGVSGLLNGAAIVKPTGANR